MSCHCIPPPASLKPRKTYKFLLEDVYSSVTDPDIGDPIAISTKSRIGKLQQYVLSNPGKAGTVSSKLNKQAKKDLSSKRLGYVKVSVYAYCELLDQSTADNSSYTFSFFNQELIHQPNCLIHTLLTHPNKQVQALGAHLLTSYLNAQTEVEHQASANADLVRKVLDLCTQGGSSGLTGTKQAVVGGVAGSLEQLQAECLCTLQAYVKFCHKIKILPDLLEKIEVALLDSMEFKMASGGGVPDVADMPGGEVTGPPDAATILRDFSPFLQDGSSVRRVIGTLLQWLDAKGRWDNQPLLERLVGLVRNACGPNTYPLSASLLRHSAAAQALTPTQRGAAARLALHKGSAYSLSILNLALLELPKALAAAEVSSSGGAGAAGQGEAGQLRDVVRQVCVDMAHEVGDPVQVCGALSSVMRAQFSSSADTTAAAAAAALDATTPPPAPAVSPAVSQRVQQHTLWCGLAVARELKGMWRKTHGTASRALPAGLLSALSGILNPDTSPRSPSQAALRPPALQILACLLDSNSPDVRDERQATQLLSAAAAATDVLEVGPPGQQTPLGQHLGLAPADVQAVTHVVGAGVSCMKPQVVVQAAQLALELGQRSAALVGQQGGGQAAGQLAAAVYAALAESCMHQLGRPGAPPAYAALTRIKVIPSGVALPSLRTSPDVNLSAARSDWGPDDAAAAAGLAPQLLAGLQAWREASVKVLKTEGVLPPEHIASLDAYLHPTPPSTTTTTTGHPPTTAAMIAPRSMPGQFTAAAAAGGGVESGRRKLGFSARHQDVKSQRVMIQKVMEMLGSDEEEAVGHEPNATTSAATAAAGQVVTAGNGVSAVDIAMSVKPGVQLRGPARVATSLRQVVALAAEEVQKATGGGSGRQPGTGVVEEEQQQQPSLQQLMSQIDPLAA